MYLFFHRLRIFLSVVIVLAIAAGVVYVILLRTYEERVNNFYQQVTVAVATAVQNTLYEVTRTAEAPLNRFQLVTVGPGESLETVAKRYGTSLLTLQIANGLDSNVTSGDGSTLVVPLNMETLNPPRVFNVYTAQYGDTLASIAEGQHMSLSLLQEDNPVLAQRGLIPGDIVFVSIELLT